MRSNKKPGRPKVARNGYKGRPKGTGKRKIKTKSTTKRQKCEETHPKGSCRVTFLDPERGETIKLYIINVYIILILWNCFF